MLILKASVTKVLATLTRPSAYSFSFHSMILLPFSKGGIERSCDFFEENAFINAMVGKY